MFQVATIFVALAVAFEDQQVKRPELAKTLVAQMAVGQFDKVVDPFDQTMKRALPADKLKEVWEDLTKQYGQFQRATETRTEKIKQYDVVYVACEFQRGKLDTKVVFDGTKVTGPAKIAQRRFHIPFISMTAGDQHEFQMRHGNQATAQRIAEQVRISLQAWREGRRCDGVVTYCLDKRPQSQTFPPVQKLFQQFGGMAR